MCSARSANNTPTHPINQPTNQSRYAAVDAITISWCNVRRQHIEREQIHPPNESTHRIDGISISCLEDGSPIKKHTPSGSTLTTPPPQPTPTMYMVEHITELNYCPLRREAKLAAGTTTNRQEPAGLFSLPGARETSKRTTDRPTERKNVTKTQINRKNK